MTSNHQRSRLPLASGRTSLLIAVGIVSKVAVDLVIAASFGLSVRTDCLFVAYTLPLIVEAVFYPACQSGLVPVFVRQMASREVPYKWTMLSTAFNLALLSSAALAVLGIATAPVAVWMLAPGLDPSVHDLTIDLMRLLFVSTATVGPIGVMKAFLNASGLFTPPAALELFRGVTILCVVSVGYGSYGVHAVACGYAIAGFLQLAILAGAIVRRLGWGYRLTIRPEAFKSSHVGRLFVVPCADCLLSQLILVVERVIGSFLPVGSISAISYGHRLASVATTVLFGGVEVVSLSSMAADIREGTVAHLKRAKDTFVAGLRLVCMLGIPVAIVVWVWRYPLVQLLLERGAFGSQDTLLAAPILGLYALSIPLYGCWLLLKNYLFAATRLSKVLLLSGTGAGVYTALAIPLSTYLGGRGLALAFIAGVGATCGLGSIVLARDFGPYRRALGYLVVRVTGASAAVGSILYHASGLLPQHLEGPRDLPSSIALASSLAVAGIGGGILLLVMLVALRVEEAVSFSRGVSGLSIALGSKLARRRDVDPGIPTRRVT